MPVMLERARPGDLDALLPLVRDYHAFEGIELDDAARARGIAGLLDDERAGGVWWIRADGTRVGYLALCVGYSLEFGGRDGFLDEFYLLPEARGRGTGRAALAAALDAARALGIRALHLEVGRDNERARQLYAALGFEARTRFTLMSRGLDPG